jgi:hypothetical protein
MMITCHFKDFLEFADTVYKNFLYIKESLKRCTRDMVFAAPWIPLQDRSKCHCVVMLHISFKVYISYDALKHIVFTCMCVFLLNVVYHR